MFCIGVFNVREGKNMQISSIRSTMPFVGYGRKVNNEKRIHELHQEHARIQAASEGFNAGLYGDAARELDLRENYVRPLLLKREANQWATEGCNGGLCEHDEAILEDVYGELDEITPEPLCNCPTCVSANTGFEDNRPEDIRYWNY